jgi:hypothetical protein
MIKETMGKEIVQDLGDGLVLRRGTAADADALAKFNGSIFIEPGRDPNDLIEAWTRDLASGNHPTFKPSDFTIVEKVETGEIVSSLNLISQTWEYEGIPFQVGRPELVGTLADYRNRGLVRKQFELIHQWSAERGEIMQAITGIPYYYRLYGYEMALNLGGGRMGFKPQVPALKEDEQEPFHIRPAVEADLPLIDELYRQGARRGPFACRRDEALWRYELNGKDPKNINRLDLFVILTPGGERVGFLAHPPMNWDFSLVAQLFEVKPGVSMKAVTPSLIRYLYNTGVEKAKAEGKADKFDAFGFWFGEDHPAYHLENERLPRVRKPYAWYIRIPNLPGFIQHIAPALEKRLAESPAAGHTGETRLTFYRSGLRLAFENGRLTAAEEYRPSPVGHTGDAGFPGLTFLQLLVGYRSLDELLYAFPDVWCNTDHEGLLTSLFPRQPSNVWPVS